MGTIRPPLPAMVFVGMLSPEPDLVNRCGTALSDILGPVAIQSESVAWGFSDYYQDELGSGLQRTFLFFTRLIDPAELSRIKLQTNRIEEETALSSPSGSRRRINLDPGYVTEAKVVLATTKDYSHRVYIGGGIYAEVELRFDKTRGYLPLEHSYPDFRTEACRELFGRAREQLRDSMGKGSR